MAVRLSASDLDGVARVSRTLLAPLEHASAADWQRMVARHLKALLGADQATLLLPADVGPQFFSEDLRAEDMLAFPDLVQPLDARWSMWERQSALGAWDRTTLWRPCLDDYLRSPYYNEYIVPLRLFDALGLTTPAGPAGARPAADTVASLWLHHVRPSGRSFGARGLAVCRLLLPAFTGGVAALARLGRHRASLARTLDELGLALLVIDGAGWVAHRTPALSRLLASDPEGARLVGEMGALAAAADRAAGVRGRVTGPGRSFGRASTTEPPNALAREVRTAASTYRMQAMVAAPELLGQHRSILVSLERLGAVLPSDEALRARFGLTPAQARVARLVAEGKSHAEVARVLGVSVHTARHHAEVVRAKLGVRDQVGIARALFTDGARDRAR